MTEYRAFLLDKAGHIVERREYEAEDDVQAVQVAHQYVDGHDVEVWNLNRVIGLLKRKSAPPRTG